MKILLIDDESYDGWKEVIEKVLFDGNKIDTAVNVDEAVNKLKTIQYDLIILDLRFGESDHQEIDLEKFTGYKIMTKYIRDSFFNHNYPAPILLFTASNKVWNIIEMLDAGADDYYIKEHPETGYDLNFSRKNYLRLKGDEGKKGVVITLFEKGKRRKEIWTLINKLISLSKKSIENENIKLRIEEKLKIGYGILFRKTTLHEKEQLLFNNEILAFIVFWSILEEVTQEFYGRKDNDSVEWILKKTQHKIQYKDDDGIIQTYFYSIFDELNKKEVKDQSSANKIFLSNKIAAILRYQYNWPHQKIRHEFNNKLNKYRNEIDFIHSTYEAIIYKSLKSNQDSKEGYKKCKQMLEFLFNILDIKMRNHCTE